MTTKRGYKMLTKTDDKKVQIMTKFDKKQQVNNDKI